MGAESFSNSWGRGASRLVFVRCDCSEFQAQWLLDAAPDLLEACREFVRKVETGEARSVRSYAQMKKAVAKAEGQPA